MPQLVQGKVGFLTFYTVYRQNDNVSLATNEPTIDIQQDKGEILDFSPSQL
jgi:hypothetical protein